MREPDKREPDEREPDEPPCLLVSVHIQMNRFKEKVFLFLSTLSLKETAEDEAELDDQAHEMALESLKEEARANAFADQDHVQDEDISSVNENTLMELVNTISQLTTDVTIVKNKLDNVVRKVKNAARLQEAVGVTVRQEAVGDALDDRDSPNHTPHHHKGLGQRAATATAAAALDVSGAAAGEEGLKQGRKGGGQAAATERQQLAVTPHHFAQSNGGARGEDDEDGQGGGAAGGGGGKKGVSFAIAGAAFGKFPSRPSSVCTSSSSCSFDSVQGIHMQWLPSNASYPDPHCDSLARDVSASTSGGRPKPQQHEHIQVARRGTVREKMQEEQMSIGKRLQLSDTSQAVT